MWLFLLFVAVPIIEIALFIQVGDLIGLFPTLLIVIATAALTVRFLRPFKAPLPIKFRHYLTGCKKMLNPCSGYPHGTRLR